MTAVNVKNVLKQYRQVGVQGTVDEASPHRLIQMLMEGALERISMAKGYMNLKEIPKKGESISSAISILDGLSVSLDKDAGGAIAENLEALYDYMKRRLVEANINNDFKILDEVTALLIEIKMGWDAIPEDAKNAHQEKDKYGV